MSEVINLNSGREIRDWMEANRPARTRMMACGLNEYLALSESELEGEPKKVPEDGDYYSVEHTLFTPDGDHMLTVARVYIAKNAKEALQQYVHGYPSQLTGKGVECVFTKNWGQYAYQMQEIEVSRMIDEEYLMH